MEKERGKLREKMSTVDKKLSAKNEAPKKSHKQLTAKDLHIGDSIKVLSLNLKGTVSTLPDAKGNLFVQMDCNKHLTSLCIFYANLHSNN